MAKYLPSNPSQGERSDVRRDIPVELSAVTCHAEDVVTALNLSGTLQIYSKCRTGDSNRVGGYTSLGIRVRVQVLGFRV